MSLKNLWVTCVSAVFLLALSAPRAEATTFLYGASQYSAFVQQSFTMSGSDSKGAVAAGTVMTLSGGVSVGSGYTGTPAWSVVAVTSLNCPTSGSCSADGNIWTSAETGTIYNNYTGGINHSTGGTSPIDFSNNFTQLKNLSTSLSGMAATSGDGCSYNSDSKTITCTATKAGMNVINIPASSADPNAVTAAMLGQSGIGLVFNINAGYLVVNVAGGSLALSSGSFAASDVTKLLINYSSNTTALTLGGTVDGSVLAPWAVVTAPHANGQFTGNLIAQSYSGGSLEFEGELFNELPEPGTFAMLGGGALLLWAARRRARR